MKKDEKQLYSKRVIEVADFIFANPGSRMKEVVALFCTNFHLSDRTIKTYISKAREYNKTLLKKQEEVKDEALVESARESIKRGILTREEAELILTEIAIGAGSVPPTNSERVKSIDKLSEMKGWDAPKNMNISTSQHVVINKMYKDD